jgi:homoserine O-acetyltransferase/O-succinyltransferase
MYMRLFLLLITMLFASPVAAKEWAVAESDAVYKDFKFADGKTLPELRIHYSTLGAPHRDKNREIDNAIMILHGTGGTGRQFLRPQFSDELFGPGQPLDIKRYFIILPDNIGHGLSSKPSDGLRMAFPSYDYDDMVTAQFRLVTETLGIKHLQLILGTSMGCMHAFIWGTTHPGVARRLAPFACNAMEIGGRNRAWRKMSVDAIKADPAWQSGNYTAQPEAGLRTANDLGLIAGVNPVAMQADYPTRASAEAFLEKALPARGAGADANDQIYQLESSRNYNPAPFLEKITVPVLWINSADDFINPPGLRTAEKAAKRMPKARFILIPETSQTKGHGTHSWAKFWKADLAMLLAIPVASEP